MRAFNVAAVIVRLAFQITIIGIFMSIQSKKVIITGASSGIGKALAFEYAKRGFDIGLCARRESELAELCQQIQQQYPQCQCYWQSLDVTDTQAVKDVIPQLQEKLGGLDVIIANAGITGVRRTGSGDLSTDERIFAVNLFGAIATIDIAAAIFKKQGYGQIVGISSFSAFRGIPGSAAYSASKAALTNYLQAVGTELSGRGIAVTCIHPGFINTDLADNMSKYPFVIDADKAANKMANAIDKKKKNITVPAWPWAALKYVMPLLPDKMMKNIF